MATSAERKATAIMDAQDKATAAYQASLTAPKKSQVELDALLSVAMATGSAITANQPLPAAAYTGVASRPTATAIWNGTTWVEPQKQEQKGTTARAVLESMLRGAGIPTSILPTSVSFLEQLDANGIDIDTMLEIYMNNKTFTTKTGSVIESPFYKQFTALGEGVTDPDTGKPYTAKELMAWRLGIEKKTDQYGISQTYKTDDILKRLLKSNVSVTKFEENIQDANNAATAADPSKVAALIAMGYIKDVTGLKDFYMNVDIGQQTLEDNKRLGAFATEAIRAKSLGVGFDADRIKQVAAAYGSGLTEAQAAANANKLYQGVGESLLPTIALSGMYERTGKTASEMATPLQTELENEILYAMPSERRKRLAEQNVRAFQGVSGTLKTGTGSSLSLGESRTTGLI